MSTAPTSSALIVTGIDAVAITSAEHARLERDSLLALFAALPPITDVATATQAANALREAKAFTRLIEAVRVEKKAPALDFGKRIDAAAADLTAQVEAEATRWGKIRGAWQAEQDRIAEEIRQKAWQEEQRIKREAEDKERAAQAEARRKEQEAAAAAAEVQAELAAKAARARTEEGRAKAEAAAAVAAQQAAVDAENRRQREEDDAAARDAARRTAIVDTRVAASAVMPAKPAGVATRKEIVFTVDDIVKLYEAAPYLVTLTPNTAAIKSALKGLQAGQSLPGVTHRWEYGSTVR